MNSKKNRFLPLIQIFILLFMYSCASTDGKYGIVELFHGRPKPVRMIPRAVLGDTPTGPFSSHKVQGIIVMDSGSDYQGETSFTYVTNLLNRYVDSSHQGDLPFHFFIDTEGRVFSGRQIITPAELHKGDPFTFRPDEVTKKEYIYARVAAKREPLLDLNGYVVICMLGDYDKQILTKEQEKNLFQLIANIVEDHNVPYQNIKLLKDVYPETHNPGFYLENYLQLPVLEQNIPPAPGQHRFIKQATQNQEK